METGDPPILKIFRHENGDFDQEVPYFPSCSQIVENIKSSLRLCRESFSLQHPRLGLSTSDLPDPGQCVDEEEERMCLAEVHNPLELSVLLFEDDNTRRFIIDMCSNAMDRHFIWIRFGIEIDSIAKGRSTKFIVECHRQEIIEFDNDEWLQQKYDDYIFRYDLKHRKVDDKRSREQKGNPTEFVLVDAFTRGRDKWGLEKYKSHVSAANEHITKIEQEKASLVEDYKQILEECQKMRRQLQNQGRKGQMYNIDARIVCSSLATANQRRSQHRAVNKVVGGAFESIERLKSPELRSKALVVLSKDINAAIPVKLRLAENVIEIMRTMHELARARVMTADLRHFYRILLIVTFSPPVFKSDEIIKVTRPRQERPRWIWGYSQE